MTRLLSLMLIVSGCSLYLGEPPIGPDQPDGDAGISSDAGTTSDAGSVADAGQTTADAGVAIDCPDANERPDPLLGRCVPLIGTSQACQSPDHLAANHRWVQQATVVRYAAPGASGNGETSETPKDLATLVANVGTEPTAIILAAGEYSLDETLALGIRGPISLIGVPLKPLSATKLAASFLPKQARFKSMV